MGKKAKEYDGNWMDHPQAEAAMRMFGLVWKNVVLDMASIDRKVTEENCGRLASKDPLAISGFADRLDCGDVFPKTMVAQIPDGRLVECAGVTRYLAGLELEYKKIPVYLVVVRDMDQFRDLAFYTNRLEGRGSGLEEAMARAIWLVEEREYTEVAALEAVLLPLKSKSMLKQKLLARKMKRMLVLAGVRGVEDITDSTMTALTKVKSYTTVFAECARMVLDFDLNIFQAREMARNADGVHGGEAEKLLYLKGERDRLSLEKKSASVPRHEKKRTVFLRLFHGLISVLEPVTDLEVLGIERNSDEWKAFKKSWEELKRKINSFFAG